jgi:kinesin family protein 4/21/27
MLQVLELGQVAQAHLPQPAAHTMLSITLTGQTASGEQLHTSLAFVELWAPEPRDLLGRPAAAAQVSDPALTRSLSLAYASLTSIIKALTRPRAGAANAPGGPHIPWRDSPLTRWLQQPMSEAAELLVVGTVAPGPEVGASDVPSCHA